MTSNVVSRIARLQSWLLNPPLTAPRATILVRIMAGGVFLSEGIIKFVFANQGVGRFTKLGFPHPAMTASFIFSARRAARLEYWLAVGPLPIFNQSND